MIENQAPPLQLPSQPAESALTMAPGEVGKWWKRVELSRARRKREMDGRWNPLYAAYLPPKDADADTINSNIHFRNVQLKIAEVYAQFPELQLTPLEPLAVVDPQTQQPIDPAHLVAVKRALLTKLLGRDHADVDREIRAALFEIFATSGIGAMKICYESDIAQIPVQAPGPSTTMPGAVLGLQSVPGEMQTVMQSHAVNERWRIYHFSAAKLGIPHDWTSTRYDAAPFLFEEFVIPLSKAIKDFNLPPDFSTKSTRDDMVVTDGTREPESPSAELVKGVAIWLRASYFDPSVVNSELYRELVLIEGMDKEQVARYRDSPYQDIGPDGRLTPDSMIGNPIHPIVLRGMGDSAWPIADAGFTDPLVKQENTWMAQTIKARDANIPRFLHAAKIQDAIDALKNADVGQGVAVSDDDAAGGIDRLIVPLPHLETAQSDYQGHALIRRANDETLGISSNQAGAYNSSVRSATEVATVQSNVSVRLKGEQNVLLDEILKIVRKFDALVMRYMDQPGYVAMEGQDGARVLMAFNQQMLSGRYAYDAHPDSQVTIDAAQRRDQWLKWTNFMAKSPFLNQAENARAGALLFGLDPSRAIQQPPPPGPPPIALSLNLAAPTLAQNLALPEVVTILKAHGIDLGAPSPQLLVLAAEQRLAQAQAHGGAADEVTKLSEHHAIQTGEMPGMVPPGAPPASASPPLQPAQQQPMRPQ